MGRNSGWFGAAINISENYGDIAQGSGVYGRSVTGGSTMRSVWAGVCLLGLGSALGNAQGAAGTASTQVKSEQVINPVRITGRLIFPRGEPVSFPVSMAQIEPEGLTNITSAQTDSNGTFTFLVAPARKYRIYLMEGFKTPPKTVDTSEGRDIDVGDMVFERCPPISPKTRQEPTSARLIGDLQLEQIIIEPQEPGRQRVGIPLTPPSPSPNSSFFVELPPCWSGPSLDRRAEWEALTTVYFDHYLSIESFVGGKVKWIHVVRYDPRLTPSQIQEEVQKVWLGVFWTSSSYLGWAEGSMWNIETSVEYEDGKRSSLLTDGLHVRVQDREGKHWFIRLWPAVD